MFLKVVLLCLFRLISAYFECTSTPRVNNEEQCAVAVGRGINILRNIKAKDLGFSGMQELRWSVELMGRLEACYESFLQSAMDDDCKSGMTAFVGVAESMVYAYYDLLSYWQMKLNDVSYDYYQDNELSCFKSYKQRVYCKVDKTSVLSLNLSIYKFVCYCDPPFGSDFFGEPCFRCRHKKCVKSLVNPCGDRIVETSLCRSVTLETFNFQVTIVLLALSTILFG